MDKFTDAQIQTWINQNTNLDNSKISVRIALRLLPAVFRSIRKHEKYTEDSVDTFLLNLFRVLTTQYCFTKTQYPNSLREILSSAHESLDKTAPQSQTEYSFRFGAISHSAIHLLTQNTSELHTIISITNNYFQGAAAINIDSAMHTGQELRAIATDVVYKAIEVDFDLLKNNPLASLYEQPLWLDSYPPGIQNRIDTIFEYLNVTTDFVFWRDWYQGFLDGKPLDWDLQHEITLIPDEDWNKGPAHIAALIDPIWERYKLKERIGELEALLPKDKISRHGIGGNNPPPDVGYISSPEQIISISYTALNVLKAEAKEIEPDQTRIKWAIQALGKVLKAIGRYCAELGDTFIKEGVKKAGAAAGTAGVGYAALKQPEVQSAITKVIEVASKILN